MSGGRRKEEPPQPQLANGALRVSVWSKALRSDAAWDDKDEFLDVIYWFRQIIAVVLGVIWGVLPLRGFLGIAGSFGSSFTLLSTMTDSGQRPTAAPCLVQRTFINRAQKHDGWGTFATWNLEDLYFLDRESVCWASVFSARVVTRNFLKNHLPLGKHSWICPSPTISSWIPSCTSHFQSGAVL
ncbi:respirasome Complex Assembly Factor 1 isoform X2 [Perognathus longimembris pacificus]|uniref:respirasome Complex Assembly Factor 1 isoform X2 n=1 Tax=Perognathus longimembris pacificus TaxID=214514 RepID=UPI0020198A61|nr:respirasome Complex Assembly Factor 1 isoform X2 [Perognathus longimembris pacificus]